MNRLLMLICVAIVAWPGTAAAHDLRTKVNAETETVRVEAWFDDGTPAAEAKVRVTNGQGELIASGQTDERGFWSFPRPGLGTYLIVTEEAGHRDTVRLELTAGETTVESDFRLDQSLGLIIGLVLLLGGTGAFILLRNRRRRAESRPPGEPPADRSAPPA
jgi:hypothetical protein